MNEVQPINSRIFKETCMLIGKYETKEIKT